MSNEIYPRLQTDPISQEQIMMLFSPNNEPIHVYITGQILQGDRSLSLQKRLNQHNRLLLKWIDKSVESVSMNPVDKTTLKTFWELSRRKFVMAQSYGFSSLNQIPRLIHKKSLTLGLSAQNENDSVQVEIDEGLIIPLGQKSAHSSGMIVNERGQILYVDRDASVEGRLTAQFINFSEITQVLPAPMEKQFFRMVETAKEVMARAVMVASDLIDFWERIWPMWQQAPSQDWVMDLERFMNKGSRTIDHFLEGSELEVEPIQNPIGVYDTAQIAAEVMIPIIKELQKNPGETGRHRKPTETLTRKRVVVQYVEDFLNDRHSSLLPMVPFNENFLKDLIPKLDHLVRQQPQGTRYFLMLEYLVDLTIRWLIIPPDKDFTLDPKIEFHQHVSHHKEANLAADIILGVWQYIHHPDRISRLKDDETLSSFVRDILVTYSTVTRIVEVSHKK
jgi:hypothetical protein